MRALGAYATCVLLWSCEGAVATSSIEPTAADASVNPHGSSDSVGFNQAEDQDHDGLCDDTELTVGTDPGTIDSDNDTWPDLIELALALDPLDHDIPAPEQVTYLRAQPGDVALLEATVTVNGEGNSYLGRFRDRPSLYRDAPTSEALLTRGRALSAVPPDNIRSIESDRERFLGVNGKTLLNFELEFSYPEDGPQPGCAFVYSFDYTVSSIQRQSASPLYLLVITPEEGPPTAQDFCLPGLCE